MELLQTTKESLEEKKRVVSDLNEDVKIVELMLKEAVAKSKEKTVMLKEELNKKEEYIEKMMNVISILEAAQKASVSVEEMDAYKGLGDRKSSELQDMVALVADKEELVESLKMKVDSLETSNRECKKEYAIEKRRYEIERSLMEQKLATIKEEKQTLELKFAELLERSNLDKNKKLHGAVSNDEGKFGREK
eukprot:gene19245-21173_t